jgi:hypothetical protein
MAGLSQVPAGFEVFTGDRFLDADASFSHDH